jgi:hypothetical protein
VIAITPYKCMPWDVNFRSKMFPAREKLFVYIPLEHINTWNKISEVELLIGARKFFTPERRGGGGRGGGGRKTFATSVSVHMGNRCKTQLWNFHELTSVCAPVVIPSPTRLDRLTWVGECGVSSPYTPQGGQADTVVKLAHLYGIQPEYTPWTVHFIIFITHSNLTECTSCTHICQNTVDEMIISQILL